MWMVLLGADFAEEEGLLSADLAGCLEVTVGQGVGYLVLVP
jgi:hypothetical protein